MNTPVYLDYNATTPVRPQARAAAWPMRSNWAAIRPSVHAAGRAARALMEAARESDARLIAAPASTVIFLSGGTEANALAMESAVAAGSRRLIVSAIEHATIIESAKACGAAEVEYLPVDANGVADLDWLRLLGWPPGTPPTGKPFVALMLANNETGVIQLHSGGLRELVRAAGPEGGGWLHVDAIQAAGKIAVDSRALGADTLSISAHKIGGPQGVGALTFGPRAVLTRLQHGGGQERGSRAGTENVPGINGFGAAASLCDELSDHSAWRDAAAERLKTAGAVVMGEGRAAPCPTPSASRPPA